MKNRPFQQRLHHALHGGWYAFQRENSLRTQVLLVGAGSLWLLGWQASAIHWLLFALASALMLAAELFNSAIEALCDHLHPERHPAIGRVKDMAAGAVLITTLPFVLSLLAPLWVYIGS